MIVSLLVDLQLVRCQIHFDCPQLPPLTLPAKTIHELRSQDIKVVMALGDSVTAGTPMLKICPDLFLFLILWSIPQGLE